MKRPRVLSVLLAALLVFPLLPAGLIPADASSTMLGANTTNLNDGYTYKVSSNLTNENRLVVDGDVILEIYAGATLTLPKGIQVYSDTEENGVTKHNKLTIRGEGTLIANAEEGYAAIGSNFTYGEIVIEGCTVYATGGDFAAGIGGGRRSAGGSDILISGGTVVAAGGNFGGAGIGGGANDDWSGFYGSCGNVTITGGSVTATGNNGGAGIGGGGAGMYASGAGVVGTIKILGGSVDARSDEYGYCIGPGRNPSNPQNDAEPGVIILGPVEQLSAAKISGTVTIQEGTVLTDGTNEYSGTLTSGQLSAFQSAVITTLSYRECVLVNGVYYYVYSGFTVTDGAPGVNEYNDVGNLVDNDKTNKYCRADHSGYAEFHTEGDGFVPYGYILTTAYDTASFSMRNPRDWVVFAKVNESDDWTVLDTVTGDEVLEGTSYIDYFYPIDYTSENAVLMGNYRYFRFEVYDNCGANYVQLGELRFYGKDTGVQPIHARSSTCLKIGYSRDCFRSSDGAYWADEACTQQLSASSVEIPLAAHTPVYIDAVPHTSTSNGTIAYYECSVCGRTFADQACTQELTQSEIIDYLLVPYLNETGEAATLQSSFTAVVSGTTNWSSGWYVVFGDVRMSSSSVTVNGTVNLLLCDGATLTVNGINVSQTNAINIFAQSTGDGMGTLNATGYSQSAGIGGKFGGNDVHSGCISVYGGRINATGGTYSAGIGGAEHGGGNVLIAGGIVTAHGGGTSGRSGGAGIGGGFNGAGGNVTITGGVVNATGSYASAGIGGGGHGASGTITITGGTVTASHGTTHGTGIGSGCEADIYGGVINISGGVIRATGLDVPSIGSEGYGVQINITGGQIIDAGVIGGRSSSGNETVVTISLQNDGDYISCDSVQASTVTLNGAHLVEKNGTALRADYETVCAGGCIKRFTGTFYTVRFFDGSNVYESYIIPSGYPLQRPAVNPHKSGYEFKYWQKGNAEYDFSLPVTSSFDLQAYYEVAPPLTYLNGSGGSTTTRDYVLLSSQSGDLTLAPGTYSVLGDVTIGGRLYVTGETILVLQNGTKLKTGGISIYADGDLSIFGQEAVEGVAQGKLDSTSIVFIENPASDDNRIAIYGGEVTAAGGNFEAAIGGAQYIRANVLIAGGTVSAYGGHQGSAIGTGNSASGGSVIVSGGTVNAIGKYGWSVGIGSGDASTGLSIVISGGTVNATGSGNCPGIGASDRECSVTITGGVVNACGGDINYGSSASIGVGRGKDGGTVSITGGKINASENEYSLGIGGSTEGGSTRIILGTTGITDFIYANAYKGTVTFANRLKLKGTDPAVIATVDNIAGQTLVDAAVQYYTVRFVDENGTTVLGTSLVFPHDTVAAIEAPDKIDLDKLFSGWYLNDALYDFDTEVTSDLMLKAVYEPIPTPSGSGTRADPYLIASTDDWNKIADLVNLYRHDLAGTYSKMVADVAITRMIGTPTYKYAGEFDGQGFTLSLDLTSSDQMCAPFSYVQGATLRRIVTAGTVVSSGYHASGLVGASYGVTIVDCKVSASILFDPSMTKVHSGSFIGHGLSSPFTIEGCVFDGTIGYNGFSMNTLSNVGGFVGWDDNSTPDIRNCINAGTFESGGSGISPIARVNGHGTITNCCTTFVTNSQGDNNDDRGSYAYRVIPGADLAFGFESATVYGVSGITAGACGLIRGGTVYASNGQTVVITYTYSGAIPQSALRISVRTPASCSVENGKITMTLADSDVSVTAVRATDLSTLTAGADPILYTGEILTPAVWIRDGDMTLVGGIDYTYVVSPATVRDAGFYTVTFTGIGSYTGTATATFEVCVHDTKLLYDDGWYVNMPAGDGVEMNLDLTRESNGFSIRVYDCGGKDGDYETYQNSCLNVTAPAGSVIKVTGSGNTENFYDYLVFYSDLAGNNRLGSEKYTGTAFTVQVDGEAMYTPGNTLRIYFHSDGNTVASGYELTVRVVSINEFVTVKYTYGGSSVSKNVALGDEIELGNFYELFADDLPAGKSFKCWKSGNDEYAAGSLYSATSDVTFTAVITDNPKYSFNGNGQPCLEDPTTTIVGPVPVAYGAVITLPYYTAYFSLPFGSIFIGWSAKGTVYYPGDEYVVTEDVVFTAIWFDPTPAITGDVNGDGIVTILDVTALLDHLSNSSNVIDMNAADLDENGVITINDVSRLLDLLSGIV